jgi:DNA-binding CsgD family transcriptional regulator
MATPSLPSTSPADGDGHDDGASATGSLRLPPLLIGVLSLIAVGGIVDLILDRPTTLLSAHVIFEGSMVALSLGCIVVLWRGWRATARDLARTQYSLVATQRSLEARQSERDAWRASAEEALAGLGVAIDRQFAKWGLTPTEREVALLLLQGLGHKQVAARTGRSERTVRQHAVSVYEKSGLGGRAELAAFFLQDLMLPRDEGQHDVPSPP